MTLEEIYKLVELFGLYIDYDQFFDVSIRYAYQIQWSQH